jgi:uncharacterized phage-associated protein
MAAATHSYLLASEPKVRGGAMFSQRRVAQMAAYLLGREKGRMNYTKLMKLLYLADRESMKRYGHPISDNRYVSMDHGPVLSTTYNLIKGAVRFVEQGWNYWIADKADYDVELKRKATREALDELSDANLDVLSDIYAKFGKMDEWRLVDYTHRYCREWTDPKGSSIPIEYEDIFKAFGRTSAEARRLGARLEQQRKIDRLFATL